MKFIHSADLHLDSPFLGLKDVPQEFAKTIYQSTFQAFQNLVNDAIQFKVDFICISGDIFDRDQHSIAAESFFNEQCLRLEEARIPVYLSFGNHDYQKVDNQLQFPDNVTVFDNHVETKVLELADGQRVAISGFSYETRWITDDRLSEFPSRNRQVDWQIGLLHGALSGLKSPHANYAPFQLKELLAKKYDYWALGHIHKRQVLNQQPPIIYSGNTQGRHKNEAGKKGYYLVTSQGDTLVPEFHECEAAIWRSIQVMVRPTEMVPDVLSDVQSAVETDGVFHELSLISVVLKAEALSQEVQIQLDNGTLLLRLQRQLGTQHKEMWPYELVLETPPKKMNFDDFDHDSWQQAETETFTKAQVATVADKLFAYDFIESYFSSNEAIEKVRLAAIEQLNGKKSKGF